MEKEVLDAIEIDKALGLLKEEVNNNKTENNNEQNQPTEN